MAAVDTAKLVASLTLDAKGFNAGIKNAQKNLGGLESSVGRIGQKAQQGLSSFTKNVGLIGIGAVGVIGVAVKSGLDDLSKLNSAISATDAAIASVGATGQVTGKQVAAWANEIESNIGAAFDDKDITAAAATLLRFGKVAPKLLEPALVVTADLATKTGDVASAAALLAKALADPAKAAGKLAKSGVVLTKAQQATIKEMVKQNDIAGAQKIIIDALSKTTAGAAAASQDKYARSLSLLNDVSEDARKALAEGFLPVISRVAELLNKKIGDPKFLAGIKEFGNTLAGGLDDLVSIAEKLPWGAIGQSLQLAGAGAKTVLNAFVALPPWVQTAVLTGWGLNKLTGGALGGIVGELAKGLVKGVLGIQAAQVNITAANVTGLGGGIPGTAPVAGAGGGTSLLSKVTSLILPAAVTISVASAAFAASGIFDPSHRDSKGNVARTTNDPKQQIANIIAAIKQLTPRAAGGDTVAQRQLAEQTALLAKLQGTQADANRALQASLGETPKLQNVTNERLEAIKGFTQTSATAAKNAAADVVAATQQAAADQVHTTERHEAIISQKVAEGNAVARQAAQLAAGDSRSEQAAVRNAATQTASATVTAGNKSAAAGNVVATAVKNKDLSVTVNNKLTISTKVSVSNDLNAKNNYKSVYNVAF